MSLGEGWESKVALENKKCHRDFVTLCEENEQKALKLLQDFRSSLVAEGINNCVTNDSAILTLRMPISICTSRAYLEFMQWLNSQKLLAAITKDDDEIYLSITYQH